MSDSNCCSEPGNQEILDLCDKRRELRKKRFEPEGSEKCKEMNNKIKRCMKKAKENWIGKQCYRGKQLLYKIVQENASQKSTDTEPMDRILLWAVQLQGQCRSISIELSPDRHRGWAPHPSQRSWSFSTVEEREVSWSRQHPSRTGPNRRRGCNHRSHDNLQQDLADRRMANPWTQSLVITLPKKGNLQQCQN